jgi:hypothetical protein
MSSWRVLWNFRCQFICYRNKNFDLIGFFFIVILLYISTFYNYIAILEKKMKKYIENLLYSFVLKLIILILLLQVCVIHEIVHRDGYDLDNGDSLWYGRWVRLALDSYRYLQQSSRIMHFSHLCVETKSTTTLTCTALQGTSSKLSRV